jgi:hypothetical protein
VKGGPRRSADAEAVLVEGLRWHSSVVERVLGKDEVLGSIPSASFGGIRHLAPDTGASAECRMMNDELGRTVSSFIILAFALIGVWSLMSNVEDMAGGR